jgi:lipoprotein-releasing system ATP-binding protein
VAIARALINKPAVVLADEPTGNLDTQNSQAIFSLLNELRLALKQTFILVTHNDELAGLSDRSYRMVDGQLHL